MTTHTIMDEVFSVGNHEGSNTTPETLKRIVTNFSKLKDKFDIPLKLGHNDEQAMTDGQPALGWVDALVLDDDDNPKTVFARYTDVPTIVYEAIKRKLYRKRSIELEDQIRGGVIYRDVLTAIALLGADLPRVEKLGDLSKYLASRADNKPDKILISDARDASVTRQQGIKFSASLKPKREEVTTMTLEEIKVLQDALVASKLETATLTADNAKLKADGEVFSKRITDIEETTRLSAVASARKIVTGWFDVAVKDERITPAKRELFSKLLGVADDAKVLEIVEADVTALIGETKTFSKKATAKGSSAADDTGDESPTEVIERKTFAHMEKSGNTDFSASMLIVMKANPKLSREHIDSNGIYKETVE